MTRPEVTTRRRWRKLLALLALGALLLALSSDPAGAATTFTINKTGDASDSNIANSRCDTSSKKGNQCTLRAAIEESNDTSGADTIEFDIGDTNSVKTITPASGLPTITDTVTIDGYTQRGARENTLEEGSDAVLKVQLDGSGAGVSANGLKIAASDSKIKGLVINRFDQNGVIILAGATGNSVEGNFIGTNASGTADRGNGTNGVYISGESGNTVGGTQPAQRNLLSGNGLDGVIVFGGETDNRVEGNLIGTTADGTGDLGNTRNGVLVGEADNTAVGGTEPGATNTISGNGADGVVINGSDATGNSVLSNSIFSNEGLGIELDLASGVTENDADDTDTGPNRLQNYPVLTSASPTTITGTLNSSPGKTFTIEFFSNPAANFPTGFGEGETFLRETTVRTNERGRASFAVATSVAAGQFVTATATDASGNTSEFSQARVVAES